MAETAAPFRIEALTSSFDRTNFTSGVEPLDRYFATQVAQDIRRRVAACFVAAEQASGEVVGYYTIAASSIPLTDLSPEIAKMLPRYPVILVVRVGRLAVAGSHRGTGLGAGLLVNSMERALAAEIAASAIVVDAKDEAAAAFCTHHGFIPFSSTLTTLFLPLAQAARALGVSRS